MIINTKTASGFDSFFRNNTPLKEETMPNVIVNKSQDKNEVTIDELVPFGTELSAKSYQFISRYFIFQTQFQ